jgi:hypothetical protein
MTSSRDTDLATADGILESADVVLWSGSAQSGPLNRAFFVDDTILAGRLL